MHVKVNLLDLETRKIIPIRKPQIKDRSAHRTFQGLKRNFGFSYVDNDNDIDSDNDNANDNDNNNNDNNDNNNDNDNGKRDPEKFLNSHSFQEQSVRRILYIKSQ